MNSLFILVIFGLIGYGLFWAYMFICRPDEYAAMCQRQHEREMAKEAARQEASGKLLGGVAGGVAKVLLGNIFNHKRPGGW